MKAKSLSVFRTKLRSTDASTVLVSIGDVIEGDDEHLRALARNRLVELLEDGTAAKPAKPAKNTAQAPAKPAAKPGTAAKPAKPAKPAKGATGEAQQNNAEGAPAEGAA